MCAEVFFHILLLPSPTATLRLTKKLGDVESSMNSLYKIRVLLHVCFYGRKRVRLCLCGSVCVCVCVEAFVSTCVHVQIRILMDSVSQKFLRGLRFLVYLKMPLLHI